MKNNNKGLSLVEMVIVIAILSVLAGVASIGLSSVVSKPAEECAMKMESVLKNARITTMGKQNVWIEFSQTSEGAPIYVVEKTKDSASSTEKEKRTEIGQKGITVTVTLVDGSNTATQTLSACDKIVLSYSRSTGGFNKAEVVNGGSVDTSKYVKSIEVKKGSVTKTLDFAYLTGKILVE